MAWGNIYWRRVKVFALALIIYMDYKAVHRRGKQIRSKSEEDALWQEAHERNAKRVLNLLIGLEGLWVKLGQYLSTRADNHFLPRPYTSLFKQLQDSVPPRPLREVCRTIKQELGNSMEDLFTEFDETPLGSASIAQVHHATLKNGQGVVVKVQHKGVKDVILESAKSLVEWIAWAEPECDLNFMIDEWCKEAPKELDFNIEAENTRRVSKSLGRYSNDNHSSNVTRVDVRVPEVIESTEKVIMLEYMDGVRLNDIESLEALGVDKQKLVEEITRAYAHQIYVDGFFNGDPHPGNFLVSKVPPHQPILLDFGLTKSLPHATKQALAKMLLACAEMQANLSRKAWVRSIFVSVADELIFLCLDSAVLLLLKHSSPMMGDHVALLSAFSEMGLKLRSDLAEQPMELTRIFFCNSRPANEVPDSMKSCQEQQAKNTKGLQEKVKPNEKKEKLSNPVDAFPGDIVLFFRVLNLPKGLSSTMNVRIAHFEIMRPFAESVLGGSIARGPSVNKEWIHDTPVQSDVEGKLRKLLINLGNAGKILGIQVCAYKDGEVIIDTAAGILGNCDPRPVQPDSLFPVFSVSKGITSGMLHWLIDQGKVNFEENVANTWPEFSSNGKDMIKVHHVLNHTSGLHSALGNLVKEDPHVLTDWNECLDRIAMSSPETEPGHQQLYHCVSFGWLCGGIIERASEKKFQEVLEEALIRPLNLEGELYTGIPPGVEARLATLTFDTDDLGMSSSMADFPPQVANALPALFNLLIVRRAIMPAANGHCSARALARYYASLAGAGLIPPRHSSPSMPPLGSHEHIPKFSSKIPPTTKNATEEKKSSITSMWETFNFKKDDHHTQNLDKEAVVSTEENGETNSRHNSSKSMFDNPKIHDAFLGVGDYENLVYPDGNFGLGFERIKSTDGTITGFGHSGMGGSTGFCDVSNKFALP